MRQPSILQSRAVQVSLAGVLGLIAIWFFGYRPAQVRLAAAAEQRTDLIKTALDNTEKRQLLSEAQQKYTSLSSDLQRLEGVIPEASNTGSFVSSLQDIAARSGIQILSLTTKVQPKATPTKATTTTKTNTSSSTVSTKTVEQELLQSFYGTSIEVRYSGSYVAIRSFVQSIRQMERFVSISSINMSASRQTATTQTAGLLTGTVNMMIFHRQPAKD